MTQYHAAYVARHDRLVRHIAAMLGKLVPTPDELDLIVAGNLAAAVPEWVTDLVFEPIPHAAIHTRPDIWYLNEGHLFLIEVAVAGDTLRRQTEIALAKRATYAPLLAHLRAHSGWTTHLDRARLWSSRDHPPGRPGWASVDPDDTGSNQTRRCQARHTHAPGLLLPLCHRCSLHLTHAHGSPCARLCT